MPSAAKKRRKAAKKKKEQLLKAKDATNSHNNFNMDNSHGEEDSRHDDNRETASREVCSPATQDPPNHQDQFSEWEEAWDKQLEVSHEDSFIDGNKSNGMKYESKKVNIEEGGTVQVERELKLVGKSNMDKAATSVDIVQFATSASDSDVVTLPRVSDVAVDAGFEKRDIEASTVLHDDVVATSDAKTSTALNNEDKLELFYDAPAIDASVRADDTEGSPYDIQPPVGLVPGPKQTTSWKSCCGLFEVFAGSNK